MEHIEMEPGQLFLKEEEIVCNEGRTASKLSVTNTGDRPVQIGSHFHFYEVNEALQFSRVWKKIEHSIRCGGSF
jgi:urease subunit beta